MCSKKNSGSYGTRDDYDDVVDVDDYSGLLCPKKQKHNNNGGRRRVPRRGPGVAELEKIRLEEQHISTNLQLLPLPNQPEKSGPVYPFSPYPGMLIPPMFNQWKYDSSLQYLPQMNLPDQGGSGRFYQFIEPPKQTSCLVDYVPQLQDQEKIVTAKRPRHVMTETGKCNVGPNIPISRDGKQARPLDPRLKNQIQDSGTTTIGNQITIDSYTPVISTPNIPRFSVRKPFYSFLGSNKQSTHDQDRSVSLKAQRYDTVTDQTIDLRLKL